MASSDHTTFVTDAFSSRTRVTAHSGSQEVGRSVCNGGTIMYNVLDLVHSPSIKKIANHKGGPPPTSLPKVLHVLAACPCPLVPPELVNMGEQIRAHSRCRARTQCADFGGRRGGRELHTIGCIQYQRLSHVVSPPCRPWLLPCCWVAAGAEGADHGVSKADTCSTSPCLAAIHNSRGSAFPQRRPRATPTPSLSSCRCFCACSTPPRPRSLARCDDARRCEQRRTHNEAGRAVEGTTVQFSPSLTSN